MARVVATLCAGRSGRRLVQTAHGKASRDRPLLRRAHSRWIQMLAPEGERPHQNASEGKQKIPWKPPLWISAPLCSLGKTGFKPHLDLLFQTTAENTHFLCSLVWESGKAFLVAKLWVWFYKPDKLLVIICALFILHLRGAYFLLKLVSVEAALPTEIHFPVGKSEFLTPCARTGWWVGPKVHLGTRDHI